MKYLLWSIFILHSSFAFGQSKIDALTKRIEDLEKQQQDMLIMTNRQSQVNSFLNDNLTLGGFYETALTGITGPDTDTQVLNSSNILGLNLAAEYSPRIRFVTQILTGLAYGLENQHNHPDAVDFQQSDKREYKNPVFGAVLSQGYLEYGFNSNYRIQGGTGYVPFGYAFQQRELVLFIRRGGPQILRTTELVSPLWSGLNFLAHFPLTNSSWGYSFHTVTTPTSPKSPGFGGRIFWASAEDKLTAGLSAQGGKIGTEGYKTLGADVHLNLNPFLMTAEFIHGDFEEEDPWSAYIESALYVWNEEILFYLFGDYSYNARNTVGTAANFIHDPLQKWEYGTGFNWLPTPFTRIRLSATYHDYVGESAVIEGQDRDYTSFDLSAGVAF